MQIEGDTLIVETTAAVEFFQAVPRAAQRINVRLTGIEGLDEDLESVFRYLVRGFAILSALAQHTRTCTWQAAADRGAAASCAGTPGSRLCGKRSRSRRQTLCPELFGQLVLPILMPLTATLFATSALGSEIEDRTLIYLTFEADLTPEPGDRQIDRRGSWILLELLIEVALAAMYLIAAQRTSGAPLPSIGESVRATTACGRCYVPVWPARWPTALSSCCLACSHRGEVC